jgi:hypothetical protein
MSTVFGANEEVHRLDCLDFSSNDILEGTLEPGVYHPGFAGRVIEMLVEASTIMFLNPKAFEHFLAGCKTGHTFPVGIAFTGREDIAKNDKAVLLEMGKLTIPEAGCH